MHYDLTDYKTVFEKLIKVCWIYTAVMFVILNEVGTAEVSYSFFVKCKLSMSPGSQVGTKHFLVLTLKINRGNA